MNDEIKIPRLAGIIAIFLFAIIIAVAVIRVENATTNLIYKVWFKEMVQTHAEGATRSTAKRLVIDLIRKHGERYHGTKTRLMIRKIVHEHTLKEHTHGVGCGECHGG